MSEGMRSSMGTGLCSCGAVVAGAAGEGWTLTTQAMVCASGARVASLVRAMGHGKEGVELQTSPMVSSKREFAFGRGLGRRGGANFLWLLRGASSGGNVGYGDGRDLGGGPGGGRGGRGGGGGGGGSGGGGDGESGEGSGVGTGLFFPEAGAAIWLWYNNILQTHPLLSKSLTAGLLNAIADLFCQVFIEKLEDIDWKRLVSFVAIGLFMSGPGLHFWYGALPRIVTVPGVSGVLIRLALDQLIFTPLGMVSFFVVLLTLEDRRDNIRTKLEKDLWPTVVANWKVWIPFQLINFGLVPPQLQVASAGLLGMVWSVFMSYKSHT